MEVLFGVAELFVLAFFAVVFIIGVLGTFITGLFLIITDKETAYGKKTAILYAFVCIAMLNLSLASGLGLFVGDGFTRIVAIVIVLIDLKCFGWVYNKGIEQGIVSISN